MRTDKRDRRVKYTKMILKDSLVGLLKQRPIDKVSVKELCELADINRSTFYSHYTDQYDLYHHLQQEVLQQLHDNLANLSFKGSEAELLQIVHRMFEYIVENAALCQVLLAHNSDNALLKAIMSIVHEHSMREWQTSQKLPVEQTEYVLLFAVTGSIGIVKKWLETGMRVPAREMAEMVVRLSFKGFSAYL